MPISSAQPIQLTTSAFERIWMLNVKSVSDRSGFQLAPSHP